MGSSTLRAGFPLRQWLASIVPEPATTASSMYPTRNPIFKGPVILGTPENWFDPRAYTMPIAGTFGNAGRSSIRGPALFNVDTSLFKRIPIRERVTLQFRAEAFNVFNHTNFGLPNQVVFSGNTSNYSYSSSAGEITQTATTSRQIQFALKLIF